MASDSSSAVTLESIKAQLNEINDNINKVNASNDELRVIANCIITRIEVIEKMVSSHSILPKRPIKTVPTKPDSDIIGSAETEANDIPASSSAPVKQTTAENKIANVLVYFKKIIIYGDHENGRTTYSAAINKVKQSATIKKPENSEAYWVAIGNQIWRELDKNERAKIVSSYKKWQEVNNTEGSTQLEHDCAADDN